MTCCCYRKGQRTPETGLGDCLYLTGVKTQIENLLTSEIEPTLLKNSLVY